MNVFISHAEKDRRLAQKFHEGLTKYGFSVWDENQLLPGELYAVAMQNALNISDALVAILTPDGIKSRWVQSEIGYALGEERFAGRVIPVLAKSARFDQIPGILKTFKLVQLDDHEQEGIKQVAEALKSRE